jgi:hypothetical protein
VLPTRLGTKLLENAHTSVQRLSVKASP